MALVRWGIVGIVALLAFSANGQEGRKRFPPLQVPEGFEATLFASDPLIEYPSVIALGPRPGSVFQAFDYVTGLGVKIVKRDQIRLVEDSDGDGFADKTTVYADGFNSIQGLAHRAGTVYAMHAPLLTSLRDTDGDGVADERRDLVRGLGLPPEKNSNRLHCANGVTVGHDGWLYLALGDRGCDVKRPEGDRLVFNGGGILRCRPDGRDLHVFSTGLRNIYDLALDAELNVFTRDNENDGGTYMIRVCHSFFGADHGYPYLYENRQDEAMKPIADLGRGSSAGGVCYLETAFPPAYRGNLFFCEWGRSVVRYRLDRAGATFAPVKEVEFGAGAPTDPYGFKPTDAIVDHDGSLLVSDWADGQRPKRGRGRIYRIRYAAEGPSKKEEVKDPIAKLDSPSYAARLEAQAEIERQGGDGTKKLKRAVASGRLGVLGRLHGVWILARPGGRDAIESLMELARDDPDPRVRAQAVRAVADLSDPVLVDRRDLRLARRLASLARREDARVVLEVLIALGRLRWPEAPDWIAENLTRPDPALAHAAQQTLRRAGNWPAVLRLLDRPDASPVRPIALRAVTEQAVPEVVDGLIARLETETRPTRRRDYAVALARVYKKPGPWKYWGFRPGPRPANTVSWERTAAIERALDRSFGGGDAESRAATLRQMQREKAPVRTESLVAWLRTERDAGAVSAILESLQGEVREVLEEVVREKTHASSSRLAALELLVKGLNRKTEGRVLEMARSLEDSPVLAAALRDLGRRPALDSRPLLRDKLGSAVADVRAAAVRALHALNDRAAGSEVAKLLGDADPRVRAAAVSFPVEGPMEAILKLTRDGDAEVRRRSLKALGRLKEPRAVKPALTALDDRETQAAALECLARVGGPEHAAAVVKAAATNRSIDVLRAAVRALAGWRRDRAVAAVQGQSGSLLLWKSGQGKTVMAAGAESRVKLDEGAAEFIVEEPTRVQFLASSNGGLEIELNGRRVYRRGKPGRFRADSDRFEVDLDRKVNRLLVKVSAPKGAEFHVRFRRKSSEAQRERLAQEALAKRGNAGRGRDVFFDEKKASCIRCHRLGDRGGRIGPDLAGVGRRFSRIHLIESILEPSRAIAPSYRNTAVRLKDGRVVAGVRVAETETTLTLGDAEGKTHEIRKSEIEARKPLSLSVMPEGLEKRLSSQEFVDLIAFLVSQK